MRTRRRFLTQRSQRSRRRPVLVFSVISVISVLKVFSAFSQPVARSDSNSQKAHEQLVEKAKRGGIDLYFEGDSITRRWGTSDAPYREFLDNWRRNFYGWNAGNFGWGADTVQNILWRRTNGELDGVHPKAIVLLARTNNLRAQGRRGIDEKTVDEVAGGIRAI